MIKFTLVYEFNKDKQLEFGTLYFDHNKVVFELDRTVDFDSWLRFGIIPVDPETKKSEGSDLFTHLNSRLPIPLRKGPLKKKMEYILESGLRAPSDRFFLQAA